MMMSVSDSDQRKKKILEIVVEAYVSTASPVGSELVAKRLRASLSPATIRNIMVELERSGLLEQPHTSAGRVPTDRGYRVYVDSVMETFQMGPEALRQMEALIHPREFDLDELLARASQALADLTQQAAFALAPTVRQSTVKQIELVPLGVRKLLCVLVANEEMVASHVIEVQEPISRDEAMGLARFLNTELVGLSFDELVASLQRRMLAERDSFYHVVKRSLDILEHALSTEPAARLFLEGASHVVSQPEFARDPRKAQDLLRGLDGEEALLRHVQQALAADGVQVRIGREVQVPGLDHCSYVAMPIAIGGEVVGGIGVLGPTRMDYRRMRAFVEGMGQSVGELLTGWNGR
jgi:heat-inducible transcriptional repressor